MSSKYLSYTLHLHIITITNVTYVFFDAYRIHMYVRIKVHMYGTARFKLDTHE